MNPRAFALALAALALGGCYTTTIRSGAPVGQPAAGGDGHWHHSMLVGGKELSGPYELDDMCRGGWSEIEKTSPQNAIVTLTTLQIDSPHSVTVKCADGAPRRRGRVVIPSP